MSLPYGPVKLVYLQTASHNLNCSDRYIPQEQEAKQQEFLALDFAKIIFEKLFTSPLVHDSFRLYFNGNEPLILPISYYEELFSIFKQVKFQSNLKDQNISFAMQTNGILITQEWCEFFRKHNIYVAVSLDGPAFLHDRKNTESEKTHEQVMKGLRLLQEFQVDFFVNCTLTRQTLDHPGALYQFFLENKIHQVNFTLEENNTADSTLQYEGVEDRYRYFMSMLRDLNWISVNKINFFDFEDALKNITEPPDNRISNPFNTPFVFINIDYQGNFSTYPSELLTMNSPQYGDFILGNFGTDTLQSALENKKFQTLKQDIEAGTNACETTCEFMDYCNGGNPYTKHAEHGTFNSTETLECRLKIKTLFDLILEALEYQAVKYKNQYLE